MNEKQLAVFFKALADENRIRIIKLLRGREMCASDLLAAMNISQPTLSHHAKILCDAGILESHKNGIWTYYRISVERIEQIQEHLKQLLI